MGGLYAGWLKAYSGRFIGEPVASSSD